MYGKVPRTWEKSRCDIVKGRSHRCHFTFSVGRSLRKVDRKEKADKRGVRNWFPGPIHKTPTVSDQDDTKHTPIPITEGFGAVSLPLLTEPPGPINGDLFEHISKYIILLPLPVGMILCLDH